MSFIESKRPETPIQFSYPQQNTTYISNEKSAFPPSLVEMMESITEGDFSSLPQLHEAILDERSNPHHYFHDRDFLNNASNPLKATLIRLNYLSACAREDLASIRIQYVLYLVECLLLLNVYHNISPMKVDVNYTGPSNGYNSLQNFTIENEGITYNLLVRKKPFIVIANGIHCLDKLKQDAALHNLLNVFGINLDHIINNKDLYKKQLCEIMNRFPVESTANPGFIHKPYPSIPPKKHVARFSHPYTPLSTIRVSHQMIPVPPPRLTPSELNIITTGSVPRLTKGFKSHFIFIRHEHIRRLFWNERQIKQVTDAVESFLVRPPNGCESQVIFSLFLLTQPKKRDNDSVLKFREDLLKKLFKVHLPSQNDLLPEDTTFENRMKKKEPLTRNDLVSRCMEFSSFYFNFRKDNHFKNFYIACQQVIPLQDINTNLKQDLLRFIENCQSRGPNTFDDEIVPVIEVMSQIEPDIARKAIMLMLNPFIKYSWGLASKLINIAIDLKLYDREELFCLLLTIDHRNILQIRNPILHLRIIELIFQNCSFTENKSIAFLMLLSSYLKTIALHPASSEAAGQIKKTLLPLLKEIHEKTKENPEFNKKYLKILEEALDYSSTHLCIFTYIEATKQEFSNLSSSSLCSKVRDYFGGEGDHRKGLVLLQKYLKTKTFEKGEIFPETTKDIDMSTEVIDELSDDEIIHYKSIFINTVDLHTDLLCLMFDAFYSIEPKTIFVRKYLFNRDFSLTLMDLKVFERFDRKMEKLKVMDKRFALRTTNSEKLPAKEPSKEKSEHKLSGLMRTMVLANLQEQKKKFGRKKGT